MADSLFTSKLRYGLQLIGKVRLNENYVKDQDIMALQKMQNKVLRLLNNVSLEDMISSVKLAERVGYLSVNQINAQTKLTKFWKFNNIQNYPFNIKSAPEISLSRESRSMSDGKLYEVHGSHQLKSTFINDGVKIWNLAPMVVKNCTSLNGAKKEIKKFAKTLPF